VDRDDREMAEFGRAVGAGENPPIEVGGSLAGGKSGDQGSRGESHPDDRDGDDEHRRKPPKGRAHGSL
jgi:hypothetical protein